jgi:hypothetical protein
MRPAKARNQAAAATSQKTAFFIVTSVKTSNLTYLISHPIFQEISVMKISILASLSSLLSWLGMWMNLKICHILSAMPGIIRHTRLFTFNGYR